MNKSPNPHEILLVYIHFKHYMNKMALITYIQLYMYTVILMWAVMFQVFGDLTGRLYPCAFK